MTRTAPLSTTIIERASEFLDRRTSRRSFLSRTAVVGSALSVAGSTYVLRPGTAYAAVCSCIGRSCQCTDLCCDGYTEFCCAIYGDNSCPPDTLLAGWWKVDNSDFCFGTARYYMDCNKRSPACSCGSSGVCRGGDTTCQCRSCGNRKDGCTVFRYGNCNNDVACVGPIMCRVVTCTKPWEIDPGCSTVPRTDNNTRYHHRPCLEPDPTPEQLAFLEALYVDFLGRHSDPGGRDYWGDILAKGAHLDSGVRDIVAYSFAFSREYVATVIIGLYRDALGREPDADGRSYWTDQMLSGTPQAAVAVALYGSGEFFARSGGTNESFVDLLFRKVLGRSPSSSERDAQVARLERGASPSDIAWNVYSSEESRRRRVSGLYLRFLGRQPDADGLRYWTDVLATREDVSLALYLAASAEYYQRAWRRYGGSA